MIKVTELQYMFQEKAEDTRGKHRKIVGNEILRI
jgi:hypothetical protein